MELIVPPPPRDSLRPNGSIDAAAAAAADRSGGGDRAAARPPAVTPRRQEGGRPDTALPSLAARSRLPAEATPAVQDEGSPPPAAAVVPAAVMDEIRSLRRIVEQQLAGFAWGEVARSEPAKTEMLRQMLDAGFSPRFARELLADLPRELDVAQALAWVRGRAERGMLTIDGEADIVDRGGIYALVGPTGVGKTTTAAKLAARCVLRHGARKLALVTTDGYRIGAHEQLRIYGRILGVPVHLARDAKDLRATLHDLRHTHMVLIDTMGMSQRDRMVGEQVAMFRDNDVRSLLLLAATGRGDTLDDVVRAYGGLGLAGCILTKVDEAASLASSLDVLIRHELRLYYVSNGQRVPEDLHLPNRPYLLHRAFKDLPESSPHRLAGVEPGLVMAGGSDGMLSVGGQRG